MPQGTAITGGFSWQQRTWVYAESLLREGRAVRPAGDTVLVLPGSHFARMYPSSCECWLLMVRGTALPGGLQRRSERG